MKATYERVVEEREIIRKAYTEADTERIRLRERVEELEALVREGAIGEALKQLREARLIIKGLVDNIAAPLAQQATGKRAKILRSVINANKQILDQAVAEIYKLRQ